MMLQIVQYQNSPPITIQTQNAGQPPSSFNNRSIYLASSAATSSLTLSIPSLFLFSRNFTKSQNSLTPSPVSVGFVLALRSASAPLRRPTSFVHGCCLFRLEFAVKAAPCCPNAGLGLSVGGRVVSWMRTSSVAREGYLVRRCLNASRCSRRML